MRRFLIVFLASAFAVRILAQEPGPSGLTPEQLEEIESVLRENRAELEEQLTSGPIAFPANATGAETVTRENAEQLGFEVELTNARLEQFRLPAEETTVQDPIRVKVRLPDSIDNAFELAYASVGAYTNGSPILSVRPEIHVEVSSGSKYFQFVAPSNVFPCLTVAATYLNPESPMHSDYYMVINLRTFASMPVEACAVGYDVAPSDGR